MKYVPGPILEKFQQSYAFLEASLVPFHLGQEGSDGVIYRFRGQDRLLKICFLGNGQQRQARLRFGKRLEFLAFVFERGVPVVEPIPLADGRLFEEVEDESGWWVAYAMRKDDRGPDVLVAFLGIDTQIDGDFERLVEFCGTVCAQELDCLRR